jgi:hypothetical protein
LSVDEADSKLDRRCFVVRDANGPALAFGYFEDGARQPDVHDHQIDLSRLGCLHALAAALHPQGLELLVQRELFGQRIA